MIEVSVAKRAGMPDEVGAVGALLIGPDGGFITGSDFLMDGGVTADRGARSVPLLRAPSRWSSLPRLIAGVASIDLSEPGKTYRGQAVIWMGCRQRHTAVSFAAMRRLAPLLLLFCVACGGSSTNEPSSALQIAGHWTGQVAFDQNGQSVTGKWVMDLTQSGTSIDGSYTADGFNGTIHGTVTTTSFSGSFTFTTSSGACSGTFPASGPASAMSLSWTQPSVPTACSDVRNVKITAQK
jgi:hypothetical protein